MTRTLLRWWSAPLALMILAACAAPPPSISLASPATRSSTSTAAEPTAEPSGSTILLIAADEGMGELRLMAVDPATGTPAPEGSIASLRTEGRALSTFAESADGRMLAVVTGESQYCEPMAGGTACWQGAGVLHLLRLPEGQWSSTELPHPSRVSAMAFDPDGSQAALVVHTRRGIQLSTFAFPAGTPLAQADLPVDPSLCGGTCTSLAYLPEGAGLVVFGAEPGTPAGLSRPQEPQVLLLDPATLSLVWSHTFENFRMGSWCEENCGGNLEGYRGMSWTPAAVFLPGTDRMLLLHADAERVTVVDFSDRQVESMEVGSRRTLLDRLLAWGALPAEAKGWAEGAWKQAVASTDGSRLYSIGRVMHVGTNPDGSPTSWDEPRGLDVLDPTDGNLLRHADLDAFSLRLSPDGRWLLAWGAENGYGPVGEVIDAESLERVASFEGWDVLPVRSLEGQSLLLASSQGSASTRFALIDPSTMTRSAAWSVDGFATLLTP